MYFQLPVIYPLTTYRSKLFDSRHCSLMQPQWTMEPWHRSLRFPGSKCVACSTLFDNFNFIHRRLGLLKRLPKTRSIPLAQPPFLLRCPQICILLKTSQYLDITTTWGRASEPGGLNRGLVERVGANIPKSQLKLHSYATFSAISASHLYLQTPLFPARE